MDRLHLQAILSDLNLGETFFDETDVDELSFRVDPQFDHDSVYVSESDLIPPTNATF